MSNVYAVGQVNTYIKNMFSQDLMLRSIYVKGEVSNLKYHSSNHIYFTLKDKSGTLACVMFAGYRINGLKFRLEEGQQIIVFGSIEVYERDGKYQLYAKEIKLDGAGDLYVRFEQLKKELSEMGMFDKEYKKPIPKYVKTVGIVTARTGAAVQDIINISKRRNPYVQLILYPAQVQGEGAAESIVSGINALQNQGVDVIIVGRGGGSIEDLWAFNEEIVARAIFACPIPIVSAVGHETDTTIADYVADLRAPTPSAAAELTVYPVDDIFREIEDYRYSMKDSFEHKLDVLRNKMKAYEKLIMAYNPKVKVREQRTYYVNLSDKLSKLMHDKLVISRHRLNMLITRAEGLSPLERLKGGYVYAVADGKPLTQISQIKPEDMVDITLKDGSAKMKVIEVSKHNTVSSSN